MVQTLEVCSGGQGLVTREEQENGETGGRDCRYASQARSGPQEQEDTGGRDCRFASQASGQVSSRRGENEGWSERWAFQATSSNQNLSPIFWVRVEASTNTPPELGETLSGEGGVDE